MTASPPRGTRDSVSVFCLWNPPLTVFRGGSIIKTRIRRGFTLIELLIVIVVVLILMAILIPVVAIVKRHAMNVASQTMLSNLTMALGRYQLTYSSYPIKPGGHGFDGQTQADFYQVPCVPLGQLSDGSEDNSALIELLHRTSNFEYPQANWKNGRLVDDFGSPVIVRFLAVTTGSFPEVKVYAWSYGYDKKNGIDASPAYTFTAGPAFDQAEMTKIQMSLNAAPDDPFQK